MGEVSGTKLSYGDQRGDHIEGENESRVSNFIAELFEAEDFRSALKADFNELHSSPEETTQWIANSCNRDHESIVERIERACIADAENADQPVPSILNILHYCCVFYENMGATDKAIKLSKKNLAYAERQADENLIRRAHSILGGAHRQDCNFDEAFAHTHMCMKIARKIKDLVGDFMASANTVSILETMGLIEDARHLSLSIARSYPFEGEKFACIQLCNASNGLRLSHLLNDRESALEFYKYAMLAARTKSKYASAINWAHFEAAVIVELALQGQQQRSERFALRTLRNAEKLGNFRVLALLACAQSDLFLLSKDLAKTKVSRNLIQSLEVHTLPFAEQHEELLRQIIKIDTFLGERANSQDPSLPRKHQRMLQVHCLKTKHRKFFAQIVGEESSSESIISINLQNPTYKLPSWVEETIIELDKNHNHSLSIKKRGLEVRRVPYDVSMLSQRLDQDSDFFSIMENWAIAVECAVGSDGYNGLRVGHLATAIAEQLSEIVSPSHLLGRACTLYDIGKISLAFSKAGAYKLRALGRFSIFSQHTVIGARLLGQFDNETMQMAACIAGAHHEWWNGCGYPFGLKEHAIPIEARICAVADAAVSLIFPLDGSHPWELSDVKNQIESMAGVQYDPMICAAFSKVINRRGYDFWNYKEPQVINISASRIVDTVA